jgi:hypothetical protein
MTAKHLLFFFAFTLFMLAGKAQRSNTAPPAAFFMDSVRIDFEKCLLDVNDIQSVNVVQGYDSTLGTEGKVYVTSKHPPMRFLTLAQIVAGQSELNTCSPILFMADGKILTDTSGIRVSTALTKTINVIKGSSIAYLNGQARSLAILSLSTKIDTATIYHIR